MKVDDIKNVLIVGAGTMGQQIGFQFAMYDSNVIMYDIKEEFLIKAMERIKRIAAGFIESGQLTQEKADAAMARIKTTVNMPDAAKNADLVSESVPEDPELKGKIFSQLNTLCPARTIFTSNTSTLLPSMYAQATGRPEKFLAFHFHDIRVTNLVDVMPHPGTSPEIVEMVREFAQRAGLLPIVLKKENSGYVFNYMLSALFGAAQTLGARGVASVEDIDRAWMNVTHMLMGPFGVMDSVGIDTVWKITDYWAKNLKDKQMLSNAEFMKKYVDRGELGQKTGKGFYSYPNPAFASKDFLKGE
jgi:3-hydroxybutyryl-CoA dehydrogenase